MVPTLPPLPVELPPPLWYTLIHSGAIWYTLVRSGTLWYAACFARVDWYRKYSNLLYWHHVHSTLCIVLCTGILLCIKTYHTSSKFADMLHSLGLLVTSCSWQNHSGQLAFSMHVNSFPKKQVAVTKPVQKRRQRKYTQNTRTLAHLQHLSCIAKLKLVLLIWICHVLHFKCAVSCSETQMWIWKCKLKEILLQHCTAVREWMVPFIGGEKTYLGSARSSLKWRRSYI